MIAKIKIKNFYLRARFQGKWSTIGPTLTVPRTSSRANVEMLVVDIVQQANNKILYFLRLQKSNFKIHIFAARAFSRKMVNNKITSAIFIKSFKFEIILNLAIKPESTSNHIIHVFFSSMDIIYLYHVCNCIDVYPQSHGSAFLLASCTLYIMNFIHITA